MDFGKVLKQWDARQANARRHARERHTQHDKVSHKKPNAPSPLQQPQASYQDTESIANQAAILPGGTSPVVGTQSQTAHRHKQHAKTHNAKPQAIPQSAIRAAQEEWIHSHLTYDKDAVADEEEAQRAERSIRYIKSMRPDARLDLHGYTQKEAWDRLSNFIDDCMRRGARKVLIIHGKGIHAADSEGVLSGVVRSFIELDGRCGRSGHPDRKHGGSGATWVMLKR